MKKMISLPMLSLVFYIISICGFTIIIVLEDEPAIRLLVMALVLMTLYLYSQSLRMLI